MNIVNYRKLGCMSPFLHNAVDDFASRGGLQRPLDEFIQAAIEVCGARSATVCFVNEGEGLLTVFGPRMPHRLEQTVALAGRAVELWRQMRDAPGWLWRARETAEGAASSTPADVEGPGHDACLTIRLHGVPIGYLTLAFDRSARLSRSRLQVLRMLAQQVLPGSATSGRVGTPAPAVDDPATSLAQVDDALCASSAKLESESLDPFLESIVRHAVEIAGASAGSLALRSADESHLEVVSALQGDTGGGRIVASGAAGRIVPLIGFARDLWQDIQRSAEQLWQPLDARRIPAPLRDWYESRDFHDALLVPIRLGGTTYGHLALLFGAQGRPGKARLQVLRLLAQQAAVAMRLKCIGDSARESAVARERVAATVAERSRMAGEIHDGLAQTFVAVMTQVRAARIGRSLHKGGVSQFLDRLESLAAEGLEEARRSVFALRSIALESSGLVAALRRLVGSLSIAGRTRCVFVNRAGAAAVSPAVEDAAYRIVQEATQNALKHAQARQVKVKMEQADGRLRVSIEDDGLGVAEDAIQRACERGGLKAMRERAEGCGGSLVVERRSPRGTRIAVLLPRSAPT